MYLTTLVVLTCSYILKVSVEVDYDFGMQYTDEYVAVQVFGYENLKNVGPYKGCCNMRTNLTCHPCQYSTYVFVDMENRFEEDYYDIITYKYEIGTFSKKASSLFETFYFERPMSYDYWYDHQIKIFNKGNNSSAIDNYDVFNTNNWGTFKFDGVYGLNGYVKLWYIYQLKNYFVTGYASGYITINSLWIKNNYVGETRKCCNPFDKTDTCSTPCDFFFNVIEPRFSYHLTQRVVKGQRESNIYNLDLILQLDSLEFIQQDNTVKFEVKLAQNKKIQDKFITPPFSIYPNRYYSFINLDGTYNNIVANITVHSNCINYVGEKCKTYCIPLIGTEYCDDIIGKKFCLNGATDFLSCDNFVTSCTPNYCFNNGTCQITDSGLSCICPTGYKGKYCEKFECKYNCNNRGACISPNICFCQYPFIGSECKEQMNNEVKRILGVKNEISSLLNNTIKLKELESILSERNSKILNCRQNCLYGKCVSSTLTDKLDCNCIMGYIGPSCDKKIQPISTRRNSASTSLKGVLGGLVIANLFLILVISYLIFSGLRRKKNVSGEDDI